MSTIHNPTHFDPAHYSVVDYFDNKPPEYHFGMSLEHFYEMRKQWEQDLLLLFPDRKAFQCVHCGNGNVRYIVCATHKPTNQNVCFGADCAHKLQFANLNDLRLAQLKAQAELQTKSLKLYGKYLIFCREHPEVVQAEANITHPAHANNSFARDVLSKLKQYGELSARQIECLLASMKRDHEFAAKKATEIKPTEPAPEGRITVQGKVLSVKLVHGAFGPVNKMLIELVNHTKVWVTVPDSVDINKDDIVEVKASFVRSVTDQYFAIGKRPVVTSIRSNTVDKGLQG